MAGKYVWPDGTKNHSISWAVHQAHLSAGQPAGPAKGIVYPAAKGSGPAKGILYPTSPGAAPTPAPAVPSQPPLDPALDAIIAGLGRSRDTTISGLEAQKPQVLARYGYKATSYDQTGAPVGLTFDPNNPYSEAALLKRRYDQTQAGTTNSLAARGLHNSGAFRHARATNEFGYNASSDALIKALTAVLTGIAGSEQTARTNYETGVAQARGQRMPTA